MENLRTSLNQIGYNEDVTDAALYPGSERSNILTFLFTKLTQPAAIPLETILSKVCIGDEVGLAEDELLSQSKPAVLFVHKNIMACACHCCSWFLFNTSCCVLQGMQCY